MADLRIPIITHIHELAFWINQAGDLNLRQVESASNHIICASNAVKNYLQSRQMFENTPIETIYEHVNVNELRVTSDRKSLKEKLGLPANAFLVGASGAELWRKGKNWFIPIALQTFNLAPDKPIHFIWIGGALTYELEYDLIKSGLTDRVHFIPHLPQANKYFHEFDVFLMLSREDPFPVVSLEAAALGVPIICFQNAGGTQEWLSHGGDLS